MLRPFAVSLAICSLVTTSAIAQTIHGRDGIRLPAPPAAKKVPATDDYFGTKVTDNYRWLEDANSSDTRAFINNENAYTQRYLEQARIRPQIANDLDSLEQVSTWTVPIQRGDDIFFSKRLSGEDQASIYMRPGWTDKDKRLIDPSQFSRNPNTSVELMDVSRDGSLVAYGVREGGEDQTTIHIYNVKTGKTLFDTLPRGIYWSVNFAPDNKGVYYTRTDQKGSLVFLHTIGTFSEQPDALIFGHKFRGEDLGPNGIIESSVSDDGRYLVVEVENGVPPSSEDIVYRDLTKPHSYFEILTWGVQSRFTAIEDRGSWYVKTDYKAPNGCIMRADPGIMPDSWDMIVPPGTDSIADFSIAGGKLYVQRLKDVKPETSIYSLQGKLLGSLPVDGIGSISSLKGRAADRYGFYSFESLIVPPTIYRFDTMTGRRDVFAQTKVPFDSSQYQLVQVFYTSKDGTRIPMFIAGKKGLKRDGSERLLMTGYGGFNMSELPVWNPMFAWWVEQGGLFSLPNLRGGGEYGQQWHHAGMLAQKQNVFDDFYSAAEYLIANKYTSPQQFAIYGRSNGGLLVGAAMIQRPDLFSAVLCAYPLLDMLRYQKFEQGSHWITEYGSSESEQQFKYLLQYSPYQNVKAGAKYPAVMFFTGDDDTRVDPLHARKMTAVMQADSAGGRPILMHYGLSNGHSSGVGIDQKIQDDTGMLTFLWTETGQPMPQKSDSH